MQSSQFSINSTTGAIYSSQSLTWQVNASLYTLVVIAMDVGTPDLVSNASVAIKVLDINDNPPKFLPSSSPAILVLYTNAQRYQFIGNITAYDSDEVGPNSLIEYSIIGGGVNFFIDNTTGSLYVNVTPTLTTAYLVYNITILAKDYGNPPLNATQSVSIYVINVTSFVPSFINATYQFQMNQNSSQGTSVGQVMAINPPIPVNKTIVYTIDGTPYFTIDETGTIKSVNMFFNMRTLAWVNFTVLASFTNSSHLVAAVATVNVNIINLNAFPTQILGTNIVSVDDSFTIGTVIGRVIAQDNDSISRLSYTLSIQYNLIAVDASNGDITVSQKIDYLSITSSLSCTPPPGQKCLTFIVSVKDLTSGERTSMSQILYIVSIQNHPPVFTQPLYNTSILENVTVGYTLTFNPPIIATQVDYGSNPMLSIQASQNISEFLIGPYNGIITVAKRLDYETRSVYSFNITATNALNYTGTATVVIQLLNVNDGTPTFDYPVYNASISEGASNGTIVAMPRATDTDIGTYGQVKYSIIAGNSQNTFRIDSVYGTIYLNGPLNWVNTPTYNITVLASDMGTPPSFSTAFVVVSVLPVNNHAPYLTNNSYYGHVYGPPVINTSVWEAGSTNPLKITAADLDVQATNTILFLGSNSLPFNVNPTTGVVYITTNASYLQGTYSFLVIARDDTNLYSQFATVYISVDAFNKPTFLSQYSASVPELALPGYLLTTVSAANGINSSQVQYTITNIFPTVAGNPFFINHSTGAIHTTRNLPAAAAFLHYDVVVMAVSTIYSSLYDQTTVPVQVMPAILLSAHLSENQAPPAFIVSLVQNFAFSPSSYAVIQNSSSFYVNDSTGSLFALVSFNYEAPPTTFNFIVQARNATASRGQNISVTVYIDNVNDEPPVFAQSWFNGSVSELAPVGYRVLSVYASNTYPQQPVVYSILTPGVPFAINNATGDITVGAANVLNYDHPSINPRFYVLNVSATNGRLATCSVYIIVLDANDNSPTFNLSNFGVYYLSNSLQNGSIAFRVYAYDIDSGLNALITYSIVSSNPPVCGTLFSINVTTGDMVVTSPLPQSLIGQTCSFVVQAQDNGVPPLASQVVVQAIFSNNNLYAPVFTNNSCCGFVLQYSPAGTSVMQLSATDPDPHVIVYTAVGGNLTYFNVTKDGLVQVAQGAVLGPSTWPVFTLLVVATDYGTPSLSSLPYTVTITLIDVDYLRPVFSRGAYNTSVRESTPVGSVLVTTMATNRDIYPNSGVVYWFAKNSEGQTDYGKFSIRNDTGDILLSGELSVQQRQFYRLIVLAGDGRWPPTNATVNIRVLGSNTHAPTFTNLPNMTSLPEDTGDGTFVYQAKAYDPDLGANGRYYFSIVKSDISSAFRIDRDTGRIYVNGSNNFDYESGNIVWVISIMATDEAGTDNQTLTNDPGWPAVPVADPTDKSRSSVEYLTIDITDINDNAPTFVLVNTSAYYTYLLQDTFVPDEGLFVFMVAAIDIDKPGTPYSEVEFTLLSGGDDYFKINNVTGVITLVEPLINASDHYSLLVEAHDLGVPSLNSTIYVHVSVLNTSTAEHPLFTSKTYVGAVVEATPTGVLVLEVKAVDPNDTQNGTIYYTLLQNPGGCFEINVTTGAIYTTSNPVKYEVNQNFTLEVQAEDSYQMTSNAVIYLQIIDTNNSPPLFPARTFFFSVSESTMTAQLQVKAHDADSSRYAITWYKMVQTGGKPGLFVLNPFTGVVSVSASLCGALGNQTFNVTAYDNQVPSQSDSALLIILITEENKYPPVFNQPSYFSDLNAFSMAGKEVFPSLITTDADVCSGPAVFTIVSGNVNGSFAINMTTGKVTLTRNFTENDYSFVLTIMATDTGNTLLPALSSNATAIVLAGQLLPVSITAGNTGFGVYATIRQSPSQYQKNVWLAAPTANTSQTVQFSLGSSLNTSVTVSVDTSPVSELRALLITEYVHLDNPYVVVIIQGQGRTYSRASLFETDVQVLVNMTNLFANGTCVIDTTNGTCRVAIHLPQSWFALGSAKAIVSYGFFEHNLAKLGEVSMVPPVVCQPQTHQVVVSVPQKVVYPGERFDLSITANASYEVLSYLLSCNVDKRLTYIGVQYPSKYRVQTASKDGFFSVSAVNSAPITTPDVALQNFEQLLNVTLLANGLSSTFDEVNVTCRVEFMENIQQAGTNTLKQVLYISGNGRSCNLGYATVLLGPSTLRGMLSRAANTNLINSATLNGQLVSTEIITYGFTHSGDLVYPVPSLQCRTDRAVLQLNSNCSGAYLDGTETQGADPVTVYVTSGALNETVSLRVWVPTGTIIRADPPLLHRLASVSNRLCQQAFETATITVETLFVAGNLKQPAIITPMIADKVVITNPMIAKITSSSQQSLLYVYGLQPGQTDVIFGQTKTTITITADAVDVTGVKHSLVTSLRPSSLPLFVGEHYTTYASVVLDSSLQHLDTIAYVFTEAILSNGRTMQLSAENGLTFNTTDPEVLEVSPPGDSLIVRGQGENIYLESFLYPNCPNSSLLVLGSEPISVPLNLIVNLSIAIGTLYLAIPDEVDVIGVPSQTKLQVTLTHQDKTAVDVTTDPRTQYYITYHLYADANNMTTDDLYADPNNRTLYADAATNQSVFLTVAYPTFNLSSSVGPVVVVEIRKVTLCVRLFPSYSVTAWGQSITLSQYLGTANYQGAQLRVQALLSNGSTVDITASSRLQFSSSNVAVANATRGQVVAYGNGTANITVSVLGYTDSVTVRVSSSPIRVTAISNFNIALADLSGVVNSTFLPSLDLQFSDGSQYTNFLTPAGPAIPNLISFTSSDPTVVAVDNAPGRLTLRGNSLGVVTITASALSTNASSQLWVTGNVLPLLGDVDVGGLLHQTLVKGSTLSVPLYLNVTGVSLGAVELVVYYDQSIISARNPTPGPKFSHGLFGFNLSPGSIRLGAITDNDSFIGDATTLIATLNFSVIANGTGRLAVAVLTLSGRTPYASIIGDPTPRWAIAANLSFGFRNLTSFSPSPVFCLTPPCNVSACVAVRGYTPVGDTNGDCVFDLLDALFAYNYSAQWLINNALPVSPERYPYLDANWNGLIEGQDAGYLLQAHFASIPLVANLTLVAVEAPNSGCELSVTLALASWNGAPLDSAAVYVGLFHPSQDFTTQMSNTTFRLGAKVISAGVPTGAYGGWVRAASIGNSTYTIVTNASYINKSNVGLVTVISYRANTVVLTQYPTDQMAYGPLQASLNANTSVTLPGGFNPHRVLNMTLTYALCINVYAPKFTSPALFYVNKNVSINSTIGSILAYDKDSERGVPAGSVLYTLVYISVPGTIDLNPVTRAIYTTSLLNRHVYDSINLSIQAMDQGPYLYTRKSTIQNVTVFVQDININSPLSDQPTYQVYVPLLPKYTPQPRTILTFYETDNDVLSIFTTLGNASITAGDPNGTFAVYFAMVATSRYAVYLNTTRTLDWSVAPLYNLTVTLVDKQNPSLISRTYIVVTVGNNQPIITSPPMAYVFECDPINTIVQNVTVYNPDPEHNGPPTFSISSIITGNLQVKNDYFTIDVTGVIRTARALDRESSYSKFQIVLIVGYTYSEVPVILFLFVSVCDCNDLPPLVPPFYNSSVLENSPTGTLVTQVVATNGNMGPNCGNIDAFNANDSIVRYRLLTTGLPFAIDPVSGAITVNGAIDRERNSSYVLNISVHNLGVPPLWNYTTVYITVLDANDNAPLFGSPGYTGLVKEGQVLGTLVQVTPPIAATDADIGRNAAFRFSLQGPHHEDFVIDSTTGIVTTNKTLDWTVIGIYDLFVVATDLGTPPLSSNSSLRILLVYINDNPPAFNASAYNVSVSENVPIGYVVVQLTTTDKDNANQTAHYQLQSYAGSIPLPFAVNVSTGKIYTTESICTNQSVTTYNFVVNATDYPPIYNISLSSSVNVIIKVYDDNGHIPVFSLNRYHATVPNNTKSQEVILRVNAVDQDACSPPIQYTLLNNSDATAFTLDPNTGNLITETTLLSANKDFYSLTVMASGSGTPSPTTGTASVYVFVGGVSPVTFSAPSGYATGLPTQQGNAAMYFQNYRYFFNAYLGTVNRLSATFGPFTSQLSYFADPLPVSKLLGMVLNKMVYYSSPSLYVAVQAVDQYGSTSVVPVGVIVMASSSLGSVNVTGFTGPYSATLLTLSLPTSWFDQQTVVNVTYRLTSANLSNTTSDRVLTIPIRNASGCALQPPQVVATLPSHTLYVRQQASMQLDAQASSIAMHCDLGTGLTLSSVPIIPASGWEVTYAVSTPTSISLSASRQAMLGSSGSSLSPVLQLMFEASTNLGATTASINCSNLQVVTPSGALSSPVPPLQMLSRSGCQSGTGSVFLSADVVTGAFAFTDQTVLFNTAVLSGQQVGSYLQVLGVVLSTKPYLLEPFYVTNYLQLSCTSGNSRVLKVSPWCIQVYLNGSETNGAVNATILVNATTLAVSGTKLILAKDVFPISMTFQVWYPTLPLTVTTSDSVLNALAGWRAWNGSVCVQGYQNSTAYTTTVFTATGHAGSTDPVHVERFVKLVSNATGVASVSGQQVIGVGVGKATITALQPTTNRSLGSALVQVVASPVYPLELDAFFSTTVNTSMPRPFPYNSTVAISASLQEPTYKGAVAQLVTVALLTDGTRPLLPSTVVTYSNDDLSIDIQGSRFQALEAGIYIPLAITWTGCGSAPVISSNQSIALTLLEPRIVVNASAHTLVHPSDPASFSVLTTAKVSVSLVYPGGVTFDITNDMDTEYNLSSPLLSMSNGFVKPAVPGRDGFVTLTITYRKYLSAEISFAVVYTNRMLLVANPYPSYPGSSYKLVSTLSALGYTGAYQQASLHFTLYLTSGVPINASSQAVYSTSPQGKTDVILNDRVQVMRVLQPGSGNVQVTASLGNVSTTLPVTISAESVYITNIGGPHLTPIDSLVGVWGTQAGRTSASVVFSDGTTLPEVFTPTGQAVPGLLTLTSSAPTMFSVDQTSGNLTILANSGNNVRLFLLANDRLGLFTSLQFCTNLLPGPRELDLGAPSGCPVPPVQRGQQFSVPVSILLDSSVGAVEVGVAYDTSLVQLTSVTAGLGWPGLTASTGRKFNGLVLAGGLVTRASSGQFNLATLQFTVISDNGVANFNAEVLTLLNTTGARLSLPQSSPAASVAAAVGNGLGFVVKLTLPLGLLPSSSNNRCQGNLPCNCSGGSDVGDLDGDCVLNIADVLYLYNRGISGQCLPSADFTNDGLCNRDDLLFLIKATYWVYYFVRDVTVTPVNTPPNSSSCFLSINASVIGRGNHVPSANALYIGFGVFGTDPNLQVGFDLTTAYSHSASRVNLLAGQLPPTANGGFFESAPVTSPSRATYKVTLASGFIGLNLGVIFYQVQKDAYGSLLDGSGYVGCGSGAIPLQFPEAVNVTIGSTAGPVSFVKPNGFSPIVVFNQTLTSYDCNGNSTPTIPSINVSIWENVTIGTIVVNSIKVSQNLSTYNFFFYQPANETLRDFSINASTGQIRVIGPLDRESVPVYHIGIGVRNVRSPNAPIIYIEVDVTILDVNDNAPVFGMAQYSFSVPENKEIGYIVGLVNATDKDLGTNALVTYTLLHSANFSVNSSTGEIRTTSVFDYEVQIVYNFAVVATDHGVPPLSTTVNVTVNIVPVNDNAPQCRNSFLLGGVDEGPTNNTFILTVVATDADKGANSTDWFIYYAIFNDTSPNFQVNMTTGDIHTRNVVFNRSVSSIYNFTVTAFNAGTLFNGTLLNCTTQISIFVREQPRFDFITSSNGYQLGNVQTLSVANSTSFARQIALLGDYLKLYGSIGDQSNRATYKRAWAPVRLDATLQQSEVWSDRSLVSAIIQLRDAAFSTAINPTPVYLRLSLSNGSSINSTPTLCGLPDLDGICQISAWVPPSWFGARDSNITVTYVVGGNSDLRRPDVVTLKAIPVTSATPWNAVTASLPIHTVYANEIFNVSVKVGVGVIAFDLILALPDSVAVSKLISQSPWSCGINSSYHGNYSVVCFRMETAIVSATSEREEVFVLLVTLDTIAGTKTRLTIGGEAVSIFASDGPVSSNPAAVMFNSRDGTTLSTAYVYVEPVTILGLLAAANRSELVNLAPLWNSSDTIPMRVYAVYNVPLLYDTITTATCSSTGSGVSVVPDCSKLQLSSNNSNGGNPLNVKVLVASKVFLLPLRVWYATNVRLFISDTELNSIDGDKCQSPVYQSTFASIYTTLVAEDSTIDIDVSDKIPNGSVVSNSSHVAVVNGNVLQGISPGESFITLASGAATPVSVAVTNKPTSAYSFAPVIFTSLGVTLESSPDGSVRVGARATLAPFSGRANSAGYVSAYVQFTDGARYYVPANHLTLNVSNPSVLSTDAISTIHSLDRSGSSYVNVSWTPATCSSPVGMASVLVNITALTPSHLVVTADQTVLLRSKGLTVPGFSNSTTLHARVYFTDGTSDNVTSDLNTSYNRDIQGGLEPSADRKNVFVALPNAMLQNVTITVIYRTASGASVNASVPLKLLDILSINASIVHYPSPGGSPPSTASSILCLLHCNTSQAFFQQVRITATATLTDSSVIPLDASTGLSYDITYRDYSFDQSSGVVTLYGNASSEQQFLVLVSSPTALLKSSMLSINVSKTAPTINYVTISVQDVDALHKQLVVNLGFSDTSSIDDIFSYAPALISMLQLFVLPNHTVNLNTSTGFITVIDDYFNLTTITASWNGGHTSVSFPTNLPAKVGQLDLGSPTGLPQSPVAMGDTFTVDVRANLGGYTLGAIEVGVAYGNLMKLVSANTTLPGYCALSDSFRAAGNAVHFACLTLGMVVSGEPVVAQLTFTAREAGVNRIEANLYVCDTSGPSPTRIPGGPNTPSHTRWMDVLVGVDASVFKWEALPPVGHNITGLGDANGDSILDVRDAAYVAQYLLDGVKTERLRLPAALEKMDVNHNGVVDSGDALYLTRVASNLLPIIINYTIATVSNPDCLLKIKVTTRLGPEGARTYLYALLTYPTWAGQNATLYRANTMAPGEYTVTLSTQLSAKQPNVGLSLLLRTIDNNNGSSPDRHAALISAPGVVGGQNLTSIADVVLSDPFASASSVRVGEWTGFSPLIVFTNDYSSDVCMSNFTVMISKTFTGVVQADHPIPTTGLDQRAVDLGLSVTTDGSLNVTRPFDVTSSPYVFAIGASFLILIVTDVNNHAPMFQQVEGYMFRVGEDTVPGTSIAHLMANDVDAGLNALVTYRLNDPSNSFEVNSTTGELFLLQKLVRGVNYTFLAIAMDSAVPPMTSLSSNVTVTIVIVERQDIRFNAGGIGFLVGPTVHSIGKANFSQTVDYLQGLSGTVQAQASLNDLLPPYGATVAVPMRPRPAQRFCARLLQEKVYYSRKTVTVFVRVVGENRRAADPSTIRVDVVAPGTFNGPTMVSSTCTTSNDDFGYCVATVGPLPDAWFARTLVNAVNDLVNVSAVLLANGVQQQETVLGRMPIEAAPNYAAGFLRSQAQLVGPSHSVSAGETFFVSVWVAPWLTLHYDNVQVQFTVLPSQYKFTWNTTSWLCSKLF